MPQSEFFVPRVNEPANLVIRLERNRFLIYPVRVLSISGATSRVRRLSDGQIQHCLTQQLRALTPDVAQLVAAPPGPHDPQLDLYA